MSNSYSGYTINVIKNTPAENVGTILSTTFESHNELVPPGPKLYQSDLHSQYFVNQKEKAFEMPFFQDGTECDIDISSCMSSSKDDYYKEDILSEGFNSSFYANQF